MRTRRRIENSRSAGRSLQARVLGYTQAFSSVGGLMDGVANVLAAKLAAVESLPAIHGGHEAWQYTLISGVIPALPLIVIRPFFPNRPLGNASGWPVSCGGRASPNCSGPGC